MNISIFLSLYLISIPIFFIIDMIWLGVVAKGFYQSRIGHLMEVSWIPAILFYLIFLIGLTYFAIYPAVHNSGGVQAVFIAGALFGFFTYATYDLTNLATLKGWPVDMVIIDMIWGTLIGGVVAALTYYVYTSVL
jgi:uncharacterized membrane protein